MAPDGYGNWLHELEQSVFQGCHALRTTMGRAPIEMLAYLEETNPGVLDKFILRAQAVDVRRNLMGLES
jgi:hypothetical protein